jgi:hypothetical protein
MNRIWSSDDIPRLLARRLGEATQGTYAKGLDVTLRRHQGRQDQGPRLARSKPEARQVCLPPLF